MHRTAEQILDDAIRIWRAGVDAVLPARLVPEFVHVDRGTLCLGDEAIPLASIDRIAIVGGGKAAGAMARALEEALGAEVLASKRVEGWVNVPESAVVPTRTVHLHAARPQGVNEPTTAAAAGVASILQRVRTLGPRDLCICLLSGGGSALLPLPMPGLLLDQKAAITRELSFRGAAIDQLNAVRRELSGIKNGGLARACRAGRLVSLILSDVLGDDLATVASGPTVLSTSAPANAIRILQQFGLGASPAGGAAIELLKQQDAAPHSLPSCRVSNIVIGNNAAAVDGAGVEAERLGYSHAMTSADASEGPAEEVARHLVNMAVQMRSHDGPDCLISGGEPTVRLAPEAVRGKGGRNQQLCLAALAELRDWRGVAFVSGGTDGEDGPTDAAGAWVDEGVARDAERLHLDAGEYLVRNDAYHFFERAGGLLKTGATQTNVCDVRVVTVSRE